jgi:hypothetical protein
LRIRVASGTLRAWQRCFEVVGAKLHVAGTGLALALGEVRLVGELTLSL